MAKQFGELDLISYILDNQELLHQANDLDSLVYKVFERMSKENYPAVLEIFAKISKVYVNKTISLLAKDLLTNGRISEAMGNVYEAPPEVFNNFVEILVNFLKFNRTIILRNSIAKVFTFTLLFEKMEEYSKSIVQKMQDRFDNPAETKDDEGKQPVTELNFDPSFFEYKFFDDIFEPNNQEYIQN